MVRLDHSARTLSDTLATWRVQLPTSSSHWCRETLTSMALGWSARGITPKSAPTVSRSTLPSQARGTKWISSSPEYVSGSSRGMNAGCGCVQKSREGFSPRSTSPGPWLRLA